MGREDYVHSMQDFMSVDIFGLCGNTTGCPHGTDCLTTLSREYKFYLAFENSICEDYVSEKLVLIYSLS